MLRLQGLTAAWQAKFRKRGATFQRDELQGRQYQSSRDGVAALGTTQHQIYDFTIAGVITDERYDGYYHLGLGPRNAINPIAFQGPIINWKLGKQSGIVEDQATGLKYNIHGYPL